jgi:methanogenic corrinoid protein MtbC1
MSSRGDYQQAQQLDASCSAEFARFFASPPNPTPERLASVVFEDIVPRLHTLHHELSAKDAEEVFSPEDITEFGEILINDDSAAADLFVEKMRAHGRSEESLFLGLMAETARHLGALWEDDRCSFVDVTIGVARLQKMLCAFNGVCDSVVMDGHRVLLCTLAGERHVFGVDMVACFMRRACWDVEVRKEVESRHVSDAVADERYAVMGFTLSAEAGLEMLCRAIQSGRAASLNPKIAVIVGGPLFRSQPNLVAQVGADAMASDAATASLLAKRLLLRQSTTHSRQSNGHNGHAYAQSHAHSRSSR